MYCVPVEHSSGYVFPGRSSKRLIFQLIIIFKYTTTSRAIFKHTSRSSVDCGLLRTCSYCFYVHLAWRCLLHKFWPSILMCVRLCATPGELGRTDPRILRTSYSFFVLRLRGATNHHKTRFWRRIQDQCLAVGSESDLNRALVDVGLFGVGNQDRSIRVQPGALSRRREFVIGRSARVST